MKENINYSNKILGKLVPKKIDNKIPIVETNQNVNNTKDVKVEKTIQIEKMKVNIVKKSNSNSNSNVEKKDIKESKC